MYIGLYYTQIGVIKCFFERTVCCILCVVLHCRVLSSISTVRMVRVAHFVVLCRLKCTFILTYGRAYYTYPIHELLVR